MVATVLHHLNKKQIELCIYIYIFISYKIMMATVFRHQYWELFYSGYIIVF